MALNGSVYLPQSELTADVEAARALTFPEQAFFPHFNWWADPAVLGAFLRCYNRFSPRKN